MIQFPSQWSPQLGRALRTRLIETLADAPYQVKAAPESPEIRLMHAYGFNRTELSHQGVIRFVHRLLLEDWPVPAGPPPADFESWRDVSTTVAAGICATLDIELI